MNYAQERLVKLKKKFGEPETLDQAFNFLLQSLQQHGDERGRLITGLAWSVGYRDRVSNTHSCPASGVTNWGCKDDKPRGYPGYSGRVWCRIGYEMDRMSWISDLFSRSQFFTGTGGSGGYDGPWQALSSARYQRYGHKRHHTYYPEIKCYSWDFRFYHDDFPLIKENWIKNNLFNVIITNTTKIDIEQYKVWEDEATVEADKKFMTECEALIAKERKSYA